MSTSGTYSFSPSLADIVLDAFDRIQIRPAALTPDHMMSARRSLNQVFVRWASRGLNLWAIDEQVVTLNTGQYNYAVPNSTVMMLETWVRQYQMGSVQDTAPVVSTTISSDSVTVTLANHGLVAGLWVTIPIYVSVGGVIIQGFYQVVTVPSDSTFTITADDSATSSVVGGGAVPVYATTANSETVTVTLASHGLSPGQVYTVHVVTVVGGIQLLGDYTVATAPTSGTLTFSALNTAGAVTSMAENSGNMQVATQSTANLPVDTFMTPISRTDWAALSIKNQPVSLPTTYYFDRTAPPSVNIWGTPSLSSPMELHYFRMRQLQDAVPQGTETADIPYRFDEVLCAELAYMLAIKWKPESAQDLLAYAKEVWLEASSEDRERVTLQLAPTLSGYYE